jgi:hypothetical protein
LGSLEGNILMREGLIIFNASFVEQDRHGMMNSDDIDISEGLFDAYFGDFKCCM